MPFLPVHGKDLSCVPNAVTFTIEINQNIKQYQNQVS